MAQKHTQADPMYDLLGKVGEIASDIKHIMHANEETKRTHREFDRRLRAVEAFRWKLLGIATVVPTLVSMIALYLKGFYHG